MSTTASSAQTREGDDKDLPKAHVADNMRNDERVEQMVNVAYVFEAGTGNTVGRYVKRNLWISERFGL